MTRHKKQKSNKQGQGKKKAAGQKSKQTKRGPVKNESTGFMSTVGTLAKAAVSKALDSIAMAEPELIPIRAGIKSVTGFSERTVSGQNNQNNGGEVVSVADAPVAFKREPISTGFKMLGQKEGVSRFWVRDMVGTVITSGTLNTFVRQPVKSFNPVAGCFPNFYSQFEDFVKWRPVALKLHYVHFAATSTKTAVMLWWIPSLTTGGDYATRTGTAVALMGNEFAVQGSAYEDFALEVSPADWKEGTWRNNYTTAGTDYALTDIFSGTFGAATDLNDVITNSIGYFYVEAEFEGCDRALPYAGVGIAKQTFRTFFNMKEDDLAENFLAWSIQQLISTAISDRKQARKPPELIELHGALHKEFMELNAQHGTPVPTGTGSSHVVSQSQVPSVMAVPRSRFL